MITPEEFTPLEKNAVIDRIVVEKGQRQMHVYLGDSLLKTYRIALGFNPIGHKEIEGDGKTPEGLYYIDSKNPNSAYHLNLGVSYPNELDKAHAEKLGKSPGGDIKIHGLKNGLGFVEAAHLQQDWTAGCIAITNEEIEELFRSVPIGTPIEIKP
ncbi:L,D-transpeptidase family protein [Tunicatimonas pelagia]|uniref:L,D-transpeptidase family protein n=1 Tax=Tunicatimonas pelagia TaxID=931531 RepID=UPI0026654E16|nr:L,D-transpeptidase family protein [Tunicatimonas pelagia]WKN42667.1 L,D-transpeptidase family protein [Tunicatimonas pelagia]